MGGDAERLDAARQAVAAACRLCRRLQRDLPRLRTVLKDDRSPVTIADLGAQALVAHVLTQRLGPPLRLVAEETSAWLRAPEHAPLLEAVREALQPDWPEVTDQALLEAVDAGAGEPEPPAFWTLDPIDGTRGFLRGGQYAVALAYISHGEVVLGVLGCPNLSPNADRPFDQPDEHGTMYLAARGQGARAAPADDARATPQPLKREGRRPQPGPRLCASFSERHTDHAALATLRQALGPAPEPLRLDSQAKYAVVARGQADAYVRIPIRRDYREFIWDHAAGTVLALETGCVVSDLEGQALDFSRGRRLTENRGLIAADPAWHERILETARRLGL